jgi:hypothetical protein
MASTAGRRLVHRGDLGNLEKKLGDTAKVAQRKALQAANGWPRVSRQSLNLRRSITQSSGRVDAIVTLPELEEPQPVTCNRVKDWGVAQIQEG